MLLGYSIKLLIVDDSIDDCTLLIKHLQRQGYESVYTRVDTEAAMVQALDSDDWDVLLCDYNMPKFDTLTALSTAKKKKPYLPFIVVSGAVSEEVAVQVLKAGANDYVLKQNLTRLIPAIERSMLEAVTQVDRDKMEAVLKKKEEELRQSQKLEAVGQLAGGIAHDFNNILATILIQTDIILDHIDNDLQLKEKTEKVYKGLEQIKKSGRRATGLTHQLLAFSRKQVLQPRVLNLNELIADMKDMLRRVIPENIQLETSLNTSLNIKADRVHMEQIIMNLVVNSRDAMPKGGLLKITTKNISVTEDHSHGPAIAPGTYVLLTVKDNGHGIDEETQKHMFEPFFTTKVVGKGSGLGLSTVYGIVKQNNGFIFVESTPPQGTIFNIYLPQFIGATESSIERHDKDIENFRGTETILITEDEEALRELIGETLTNHGYTVLYASHGAEALQIIQTYKDPIHLIVTDVVMPQMGGQELAQAARDLKIDSQFLFLSGYTEDVLIQQGIYTSQIHFLEKPFALKTLLKKVRFTLESTKSE